MLNHPDDCGGMFWHHRVLLHRLAPGRWLCASPDHELLVIDFAVKVHRLVERNADFPDDTADSLYKNLILVSFFRLAPHPVLNLKRNAITNLSRHNLRTPFFGPP